MNRPENIERMEHLVRMFLRKTERNARIPDKPFEVRHRKTGSILASRRAARPRKGERTVSTTSVSRGQSPRKWARLLRRGGKAVK